MPEDLVIVTEEDADPEEGVQVGQWYWVKSDDKYRWLGDDDCHGQVYEYKEDDDDPALWEVVPQKRWFACVVAIGSNYIEVESATNGGTCRIHADEFFDECAPELFPDAVIETRIAKHKHNANRLMRRVQELYRQLGIDPKALPEGETQALATMDAAHDVNDYKKALIEAKDTELPELFKQIEIAHKEMARWMVAKTIPLKAEVGHLSDYAGGISDRILSVELYAGLVEEVVQIKDGKPAAIDEKLHLMQRRHYMDEECLIDYRAGGMEFKNLRAFDRWLAQKKHRNRILPHPRCLVAFQVRREKKDREISGLDSFIAIGDLERADKATFIYIRNGDQIFRMNTAQEFGEKIFPDAKRDVLGSGEKLWATSRFGDWSVITDSEYQAKVAEEEKQKAETSEDDQWLLHPDSYQYKPFDQDNVEYDDISASIAKQVKEYNRIALILQGLFDRSPVLHPHPPVKLWSDEGFAAAVELVYDHDRALNPAEHPDFEAYRRKLNETIKVGTVTIGQWEVWQKRVADKEYDRMRRYGGQVFRPVRSWTPSGDDGPGEVARVANKRGTLCTFRWTRQRYRESHRHGFAPIKTSCAVEVDTLFNVDAYKPGDYKIFFDDQRTRAEYIQWASFLLTAEDYHAGKIKLDGE